MVATTDFRIDIVVDASKAQRATKQVGRDLDRVEKEAKELRAALSQALSVRDRGAAQALGRIEQILGRTEQRAIVTDTRIGQIGRDINDSNLRRFNRGLDDTARKSQNVGRLLRRVFAGFGLAIVTRQFILFSDTVTNTRNRLRLVTADLSDLTQVQNELFAISERTRTSFEGTATIFSRLAVSAKELGRTNQQLLVFTESLNQAIILSGASAQEAGQGLIQLSQGLASGALRGDELRSVLEQLPAVADVIAKSLGITRGQLRKLGEEGKITSQVILQAFAEARVELSERFATTVSTAGQAFAVLKTNVIQAVGSFNDATGVIDVLAQGVLLLGKNISTVSIAVGVFGTALGVRLAINAIPSAIVGLAGLKVATIAAGGAFTGAAAAVFFFSNRLAEFNKNAREIGEIINQIEKDAARVPAAAALLTGTQREINTINRAIDEQRKRGVEASESQRQSLDRLKSSLEALRGTLIESARGEVDRARATAEATAAQKDQEAAIVRQAKLLQAILGPGQQYKVLQADLKVLLDANKISQEAFNQAIEDSRVSFERSQGSQREDPFEKQLKSIERQNQALQIRNTQAGIAVKALQIEAALRSQGVNLTAEQQKQLAGALLRQQELNEAVQARQVLDQATQQIQLRSQELEIMASTRAGARRDALLAEVRLRARGVELSEEQVKSLERQLQRQRDLNEVVAQQNRLRRLRDTVDVLGQLKQQEEDLLLLRQQEKELIPQIDAALEDLRLRQLEGAMDLASGFERAFIRIKKEAEDLAFVGESVVNVFADRGTDALIEFARTSKASFKEFANSVLDDLIRITARLLIVKALSAFAPGLGAGAQIASGFNPGAQFGATVQPGQAPRPVNEDGRPEIFVPDRTGTIVPNAANVPQPAPQVTLQAVVVESMDMVPQVIASGAATEALIIEVGANKDRFKQVLDIG